MPTIGYHASHEQFAPSALLRYVQLAEQAGFTGVLSADHFNPWTTTQGQSGFTWSWLGAAMGATTLPFGVVNAPGQRYHPAIIAQAAATLAEMFPERFWVAVGTGQFLNERITGDGWPPKPIRQERLEECVAIIRALWAGETVTHHGHVVIEEAKLFTRPKTAPMLVGAAISAETAGWVGGWADALVTVLQPKETLQNVISAFREGGGEGKPMFLQEQIAYGTDEDATLKEAIAQWGVNTMPSLVLADTPTPWHFDALSAHVQPDDLEGSIRIGTDPARFVEWLAEDVELGFDAIYIHNVTRDQERFIDTFGERVLPVISN